MSFQPEPCVLEQERSGPWGFSLLPRHLLVPSDSLRHLSVRPLTHLQIKVNSKLWLWGRARRWSENSTPSSVVTIVRGQVSNRYGFDGRYNENWTWHTRGAGSWR